MGKQVTVNLFDVSWTQGKSQKFSDTLNEFAGLPLGDRWRSDIRLETVEFAPADAVLKRDCYLLDFAKSRTIGPGKLGDAAPVSDVGLSRRENFGEETAALYLPSKKWLLILSNQYGVGPSRIASYMNALDPGNNERHFDYQISPKIDVHAIDRMKSMKHFSQIVVTANVGAFDDDPGNIGESVKQTAAESNAMRLHLRLEANPVRKTGQFLKKNAVSRFLSEMLRNSEEVDKLEVKGGSDTEKDQLVDLLKHKIRRKYNEGDLDVVRHRYTYASKVRLLRSACRGWIDTLG